MPSEHSPPWEPVLCKRPAFKLRHDKGGQKRGHKTDPTIKQEICGKPSWMFLKFEQHCQQPEEQLTQAEKQKNKNRKSPASPNSLRAHKHVLHNRFPQRCVRQQALDFLSVCNLSRWLRIAQCTFRRKPVLSPAGKTTSLEALFAASGPLEH